MIESKQLKYFVVAADVGSFSEAARVLFTTQSSVSKVISSLEKEVGYKLFQREKNGIKLTLRGWDFYPKASSIVADFENLTAGEMGSEVERIRISFSHSSFMADCFSRFYEKYAENDVIFYVRMESTENIIKRVRYMEDEMGFVYVYPDSKPQFNYYLKKYNLTFEKLKEMNGRIYLSPEDLDIRGEGGHTVDSLRFIQSEMDEFIRYGKWVTEDGREVDIKKNISVVTNSDYIMHSMLMNNHMANASADSFNPKTGTVSPGLKLMNSAGPIEFGILTNENGRVSRHARRFERFIKEEVFHL